VCCCEQSRESRGPRAIPFITQSTKEEGHYVVGEGAVEVLSRIRGNVAVIAVAGMNVLLCLLRVCGVARGAAQCVAWFPVISASFGLARRAQDDTARGSRSC
jgi:hypothetical protein